MNLIIFLPSNASIRAKFRKWNSKILATCLFSQAMNLSRIDPKIFEHYLPLKIIESSQIWSESRKILAVCVF